MSLSGGRTSADAVDGDNITTIRGRVAHRHGRCNRRGEMPANVEGSPSSFESGLIEFICESHKADEDGPTVTPLRVGWGYCPGPGGGRHSWRQIEPTTRERLERYALPPQLRPIT